MNLFLLFLQRLQKTRYGTIQMQTLALLLVTNMIREEEEKLQDCDLQLLQLNNKSCMFKPQTQEREHKQNPRKFYLQMFI